MEPDKPADETHWADGVWSQDVPVRNGADSETGFDDQFEHLDPFGKEGDAPAPTPKRAGRGTNVLAAAMLGLCEILEPEKTEVEMVQVDDQPLDDDLGFTLDFSEVPTGEDPQGQGHR